MYIVAVFNKYTQKIQISENDKCNKKTLLSQSDFDNLIESNKIKNFLYPVYKKNKNL